MREKIPADPIMQRRASTLAPALTAKPLIFLTECASCADSTTGKLSSSMSLPSNPRIGLDILGSDQDSNFLLESLLPGLGHFQQKASLTLFGEKKNRPLLSKAPFLLFEQASQAILMEDDPILALKEKPDSSIHRGLQALQSGTIDAFISLGNTGALLAASTMKLPALPFIQRAALIAFLPTKKGQMAVLDVGANTQYKSSHLVSFAAMGIACQTVLGIQKPAVGLLNIGTEPGKGPKELRLAYQELKKKSPLFYGNIEAKEAFEGTVDVLVTDGFTGNVFLKTAEGISRLLRPDLDSQAYPGAILCGVEGIILKCHGAFSDKAILCSIEHAIKLVQGNFLQNMKEQLQHFFFMEKEEYFP